MNKKARTKFNGRLKQHAAENDETIKELYQKHLQPLVKGVRSALEGEENDQFTDFDILDLIFMGRDIDCCEAKRSFNVPGGLVNSMYHVDFAYPDKKIKKGDKVWVRNDTYQYQVDIEHEDGRWFRMSKRQWREIEHHLRHIQPN